MPPSCTQPGCPYLQTGKCLEGFDPATECPNFVAEGVATPPAQPSTIRTKDSVDLPAGTAFDPTSTYVVGREGIARVVLLAGEEDCGKTTLLASLYELFQEGRVGRFAFAGSQTLPAFEERCHDARVASNRSVPATERTKPAEGLRFLHLSLLEEQTTTRRNLLLGDMSGELYDTLRDSADECRKYDFLSRADHVVAMLNGEKISQGHHADAYTHARGLVRSLLDAGVLHAHCNLTLLTTKWDLLSTDGKAAQRVAELEKDFADKFSERLPRIRFARVAARPESSALAFGNGLESLLAGWMAVDGLRPPPILEETASSREFDRFGRVSREQS